jgi:hypothetical protein
MSKYIVVILAKHAIPGATDHGRGTRINNTNNIFGLRDQPDTSKWK